MAAAAALRAALLALAALVAGPVAAQAWTGPFAISTTADPETSADPVLRVDKDGNAVVVWLESPEPEQNNKFQVRAATIPADTAAITTLPPVSATTTANRNLAAAGLSSYLNLAMDVAPNGAAVAAWVQDTGPQAGTGSIWAARLAPGASAFGNPTAMATGFTCPNDANQGEGGSSNPQVALDGSGNGHVGWTAPCGSNDFGRRMLLRQTTDQAFGANVVPVGQNEDVALEGVVAPQLAVNPADGRTRVMYTESGGSTTPIVRKDVEASTIVPGSQQTVVPTGSNERPFWERFGFRSDGQQIMVFRRAANVFAQVEGVDTIQLDPNDGQQALNPDVKVSKDGTAVATWFENNAYWARVLPPLSQPQEWGPVHRVTETDSTLRDFTVVISDEGTAYAAWSRNAGSLYEIETSIMDPDDPNRAPGTPYQFQPVPDNLYDITNTPEGTHGDAMQPSIDVAPNGNATLAFTYVDDIDPRVRRAVSFFRNIKVTPGPGPDPGPGDPGPGPGPDPGPGPGPGPGDPGPPRDVKPPRLTSFTALRTVFAEGSKEGKVVVKHGDRSAASSRPLRVPLKVGTKLRWTVNEAGTARIRILFKGCFSVRAVGESLEPGDRCRKDFEDGVVKTFKVKSKRGKNTKAWLGKPDPGKHVRVGGKYVAFLRVTDAAGNKSVQRQLKLQIDAPRD